MSGCARNKDVGKVEMSTPDHLAKMVTDAVAAIAKEMDGRIEESLSLRDDLAVSSALFKAARAGARLGAADTAAQVSEAGVQVQLHLHGEDLDPWAEHMAAEGDGA